MAGIKAASCVFLDVGGKQGDSASSWQKSDQSDGSFGVCLCVCVCECLCEVERLSESERGSLGG